MSEFKIEGGDTKSPIRISVTSDWMAEALIIAGGIVAQSDDRVRLLFGLGIIGFGFFVGFIARVYEP